MELWAIITTLTILIGTMYYWLTRKNKLEKLGIIHMKPVLFLGNQGPIVRRKKAFAVHLQEIYNQNSEAKYVGYFDFTRPIVMIRDPELIKAITVKYFDHFVNHRQFVDPDSDPLFGKILFSMSGNKWRNMRNVLSPAFTSSKMKAMFKLMAECAEKFSDYLVAEASDKPMTIQAKEAFTRYTNDVIASCAFGVTLDSMRDRDNDFYVLGKRATNLSGLMGFKLLLTMQFPKLCKLLGIRVVERKVEMFFKNLVKSTVEIREGEGFTRPDMIQLMMESRKKEMNDGTTFSLEEMTAQAFGFFFGGFDTTSSLMCLVLHLLAEYPEVGDKLREEVDRIYDECGGAISYETINRMEYLDAVLNETLRLYPIVAVLDRVCTQNFELPPALPGKDKVTLKPGDIVNLPAYAIHRDPNYFSKPDDFYPERFIEDPKGTLHSPLYMPFGIGPRMCIGNRFALLETKVLVFHLVAKFFMKPGEKMTLPFQLTKSNGLMEPEGGFWLSLELRHRAGAESMPPNLSI